MIAMDAAFHGWSQGAQRNGPWPIERVAESFLAALDKLYDYSVPKLSILAEGLFGANCASYMIVSSINATDSGRCRGKVGRSTQSWGHRLTIDVFERVQHKRPELVESLIFASPGPMQE